MSFSPRNVSQLLVGKTAGTVADGDDTGNYAITTIPDPDTASGALANKGARITVKTTGGIKVSDFIPANASYKTVTMAAGVLKKVTVTIDITGGVINKTYAVTIDKHDHIGSPLNDRFISAYVVTDGDGKFMKADGSLSITATADLIAAELRSILGATVNMEGKEFTIAGATDEVIIEEVAERQIVGVNDGVNLPWEVNSGMKDGDVSTPFFNNSFVQAVVSAKIADLTQLKNVEWFNSGYDKDPYRETGYPYSFAADSNIVAAGVVSGDYGIFQFYKDRDATNVERQHRQLIVVGGAAAAINTILIATTA